MYYNRYAKDLPKLVNGETVRIQPTSRYRYRRWVKAQVERQVHAYVRSYSIHTEDGRCFRRNRRHLRRPVNRLFLKTTWQIPMRVEVTSHLVMGFHCTAIQWSQTIWKRDRPNLRPCRSYHPTSRTTSGQLYSKHSHSSRTGTSEYRQQGCHTSGRLSIPPATWWTLLLKCMIR